MNSISSCTQFINSTDFHFAECSFNGTRGCHLLQEYKGVIQYRSNLYIIVPMIIAFFALLFNIIYSILMILVCKKEDWRCQKRNIFLIHRSITSILIILIIYSIFFLLKSRSLSFINTSILLGLSSASYLYIGGTKVAQSLLLYTAVLHPIFYSTVLTLKHCFYIDIFITIISLAHGAIDGVSVGAIFFPDSSFFRCQPHTCQRPLTYAILTLVIIAFLIILGTYLTILYKLKGRIERSAMLSLKRSLCLMAFSSLSLIYCYTAIIVNFDAFSSLGSSNICVRFEHSKTISRLIKIVSISSSCWFLALALDPIFNCISETKIKDLLSSIRLPSRPPTVSSRYSKYSRNSAIAV